MGNRDWSLFRSKHRNTGTDILLSQYRINATHICVCSPVWSRSICVLSVYCFIGHAMLDTRYTELMLLIPSHRRKQCYNVIYYIVSLRFHSVMSKPSSERHLFQQPTGFWLTHRGWRTHICVSSDALIQIMVVASSAPSHYLNQCWNIVNWTLGNRLKWNLNRNLYIFIQEIAFEMSSGKWRSLFLGLNVLTFLGTTQREAASSCPEIINQMSHPHNANV